uniref:atlastin-3-like n=1 Tax=Ciona intestinalis TaxID=7719 RepID=UPI000EF54535|nr:atlastin-3-like [Ciona intestinalis]|eukprot:XP_026694682.1 atlastin-3-like [Ciona intestinalis]
MTGKFPQIDLEKLEEILYNYQDHPVAIISVFGEQRSGKYFLLNLLCHYLLGNQEVAVFLMDTQGSFNEDMTAGDCSVLFGLSTLLSSLQIYNLPAGLIKENDVQHVGNFASQAKDLIKSEGSASPTTLSSLLILVQNWQRSDYDYGSKGGMEYLEEVMKADQDENKDAWKMIMESFSDVKCHLLPHPGKKVVKQKGSDDFNVKVADLDKNFLVGVNDLAKCLFSEDSLVVKQLDGEPCTGEVLMRLVMELEKTARNGELPEVNTILKVNDIVEFQHKIDEIKSEYFATMKSKTGDRFIDPKMLEQFHDECFQNALKQLDDRDQFEEDQSLKYEARLVKDLKCLYEVILCYNNRRKIQEKSEIMDKVTAVRYIYMEEMEKIAGGRYLEDVDAASVVAETKAIEAFKTSTSDCNQDFVKKCENKLHEAIRSKHGKFETGNEKRKETFQVNLQSLVARYRNEYGIEMDKEIKRNGTKEALTAAHQYVFKSLMVRFINSEFEKCLPCQEEQLNSLMDEIFQCFHNYESKRELQKAEANKKLKMERMERKLDVFYGKLEADYLRIMNKEAGDASEATLNNLHEKIVSLVTAELKRAVPFTSIQENAVETCENKLRRQRWKVKEEGYTNSGALKRSEPTGLIGAAFAVLTDAVFGTKAPPNLYVNTSDLPSLRMLEVLNQ